MKYNEETAQKIIETFGLKKGTAAVWKTRGIPKKYLHPDGRIKGPKNEKPATERQRSQIALLLSDKRLNKTALPCFDSQRANDLKRGKGIATKAEYKCLYKNLKEVMQLLSNVAAAQTKEEWEQAMLEVMADKRIKHFIVFEKNMIDRLQKGLVISEGDMGAARMAAKAFHDYLSQKKGNDSKKKNISTN